ncbi:hypothetical protein CNY89_26430 [Amaricoccus sp. HAR-UPW-R2A-40]|nr:hypothetical protein CNY89_26430 [Amaricoccus sp. HAR-UPW-R2A-40]
MFAPHLIVIGNDLESNDPSAEPIDKAINDEFRNLMDGREKRGQGIFSYEELADASSFISRAQSAPWRRYPDVPDYRGARTMLCGGKLRIRREPPDPHHC